MQPPDDTTLPDDELTPQEQDETLLPDKPDVGPLPSDEELEAEDEPGDEEVPEGAFMHPSAAKDNPEIDDEEADD